MENVSQNSTVWMYWEDQIDGEGEARSKPAYYQLCQETVLRHNKNARIISRKDAEKLLGGFPGEMDDLYVAHRSDWIRKMILWRYGGLYVDSDFVCFESLESILGLCANFDYVGYKEWGGGYMDNFVACRAGSVLMKEAADEALRRIQRGNPAWTDTSTGSIEAAFQKYQWETKWITLPTHLVNPVSVVDADWFTYTGAHEGAQHRKMCLGYMTSFHSLTRWALNRTRDEILGGEERISHILRQALEY